MPFTDKDKELVIFRYKPNLIIVGTYHALNDNDKSSLESLIMDNDFIALEYDRSRLKEKLNVEISFFDFKSRYSEKEERLYCNILDALYLATYIHLNNRIINKVNQDINAELPSNISRDIKQNEFDYCLEVAEKHGKIVYLVDMPFGLFLGKLASLSFGIKLKTIWSMLTNYDYSDPETKKVIEKEREEWMIRSIETKEGSIETLTRRGILVVGNRHAYNYALQAYQKSH
jgi:pheromone shutdown protein TraB